MYGDEVRIRAAGGRNDAAVDDEGADREEGVGVEEGCDFLATCTTISFQQAPSPLLRPRNHLRPCRELTNCSEFAPNVYDHDYGHDERNDIRETRGTLKDHGVGQLERARVAVRLYAISAGDC